MTVLHNLTSQQGQGGIGLGVTTSSCNTLLSPPRSVPAKNHYFPAQLSSLPSPFSVQQSPHLTFAGTSPALRPMSLPPIGLHNSSSALTMLDACLVGDSTRRRAVEQHLRMAALTTNQLAMMTSRQFVPTNSSNFIATSSSPGRNEEPIVNRTQLLQQIIAASASNNASSSAVATTHSPPRSLDKAKATALVSHQHVLKRRDVKRDSSPKKNWPEP